MNGMQRPLKLRPSTESSKGAGQRDSTTTFHSETVLLPEHFASEVRASATRPEASLTS